jgi:hypothetical protein
MQHLRLFFVLPIVLVAQAACAQWQVTGTPVPELAPFDAAMQAIMTNHAITAAAMAVTCRDSSCSRTATR